MHKPLSSTHLLLTAGPTQESLDPVRYLSNHSSGEMGLSLAARLLADGARVTIVLGPVTLAPPRGATVVHVTTAREMSAAVRRFLPRVDAFVATAAVCDWRPATVHASKIKKGAGRRMRLTLVANPDILADAGRWKGRRRRPLLVGFALETNNLERRMRGKMSAKNLDLIIGNSPDTFGRADIRPTWLERGSQPKPLPRQTKKALSSRISRWLEKNLRGRKKI